MLGNKRQTEKRQTRGNLSEISWSSDIWKNSVTTRDRPAVSPAFQSSLVCLILTMSSTPAGTTMGLKESECGQMGVTIMAGTLGWIMEAPAAAAYAVLPVGVDTITPGRQREGGCSSQRLSRSASGGRSPPAR